MDSNQVSVFRLWSLGRATENKPRNSTKLMVIPLETASATDGETTFNPIEEEFQGVDASGKQYAVKTIGTRDIPCEWLPSENNRATPPDIRRNERVEIWELGDTGQYFWRSQGMDLKLRTLETVVFTFGASPNPGGAGLDFSTCYFLTFSAHDKHVTIGTSKANGEPYAYTIQINTKVGAIYLTDDVNNLIELDSSNNRIQLKNADDSFVKVERKGIDIKADQYIQLTCGGSTYRMEPAKIDYKSADIKGDSTGPHTLNAGGPFKFKGGVFTFTGSSYNFM